MSSGFEKSVKTGFVVSTERSGSNLVRLLLNAHSNLTAPHPFETAFPDRSVLSVLRSRNKDYLIRDVLIGKRYSHHPFSGSLCVSDVCDRIQNDLDHPFFALQSALYFEHGSQANAGRWLSKDPNVFEYADEAIDYYDDPKFVYLVRDPRDVALSFKNSNVAGIHHPVSAVDRWQKEQSIGIDLMNKHPERFHLVRYEGLLKDPEAVVEGIFDFLDVEYQPEVMYFHETDDAKSASLSSKAFKNVTNPIQSDNYGKFRDQLSPEEVKYIEKNSLDELEFFGYDPMYTETKLENYDPDIESFQKAEKRIAQKRQREYWLRSPREEVRKQFWAGFKVYMLLRYKIF